MKIAHLILVHSDPQQLERLIDRLRHKDAYFFIHVDRKADINLFKPVFEKERVFMVSDREFVKWGAYSIVQATLNGFQTILASNIGIEYVNLLSGADYPIKNADKIHQYFAENKGKNFMEFYNVMQEWKEAIPRITEYHFTNYNFPGKYFVQKWTNRILPERSMPNNLIAVGRSQWFSATTEAVSYILKYLESNPRVADFFKLTWAPDEIIFQTILYNSEFRSLLVNNNLRYIDWSSGKASPKTLDLDDKASLINSSAFFARKFDMKNKGEILDYLDQSLHPN